MNKKIPDYLRLHRDEPGTQEPGVLDLPTIETALRSFHEVTGWRLQYLDTLSKGQPRADSVPWSMPIGESEESPGRLVLLPGSAPTEAAGFDTVRPLAEAVGELVAEIHRWRSAVWHREAELAAGIPVTIHTNERRRLAVHLESVLRGGAEAIGCQAAALYLLDDATSHLKLRACWNLPKTRFLEPPRPLRGAAADLEALIGHAVALEDTELLPHWKAPEGFPAALCVPVSTASTPLGTLWFFADRVREFGPEQTHLAEIVAGRIVADLEREVLIREGLRSRQRDEARDLLTSWQQEQQPRVPPLVDGWQVAGECVQTDRLGGRFYDWCIIPDGRIAVALGHADGPPLEASVTATTLQIAMKSHAAHRHDPRHMLQQLSEALWSHSSGNRFASLFYALIDPDTGLMRYAMAGPLHALLCRPQPARCPATHLADLGPLLGTEPDTRYHQASRTIGTGHSLVVFTRRDFPVLDQDDDEPEEARVASLLSGQPGATAEEQIRLVVRDSTATTSTDRAALVVRRIR